MAEFLNMQIHYLLTKPVEFHLCRTYNRILHCLCSLGIVDNVIIPDFKHVFDHWVIEVRTIRPHLTHTCSKLKMKTIEQGVKYVQS